MGTRRIIWALALVFAGCHYELDLRPGGTSRRDAGFSDANRPDGAEPDVPIVPDAGFADAIIFPDARDFSDALIFPDVPDLPDVALPDLGFDPDAGVPDLGQALPECPVGTDAGLAPRWTPLPSTNPPSMSGHVMALDDQNRLILFGGFAAADGNVWAANAGASLNFSALLATAGPSFGGWSAHAYSSELNRLIVFGGTDTATYFDQTWMLDLGATPSWTSMIAGMQPSARASSLAVIDENRDELYLFGGEISTGTYDELWKLGPLRAGQTPAWTPIVPSGPRPGTRSAAGGAFGSVGGRDTLILYGGYTFSGGGGGGLYADVWLYDVTLSTWTLIDPGIRDRARANHRAVFHAASNSLIIAGGHDINGMPAATISRLDLASRCWQMLSPSGSGPGPIVFHGMVLRGDRVLIYGGDPGLQQAAFELLLR